MPAYDVIHRQLWDSKSFRSLSENARILFIYLLTCKHRYTFGYFILGDGETTDDLQWQPRRLRGAWADILRSPDMVKRDEENRIIFVVNALKFNKPANPNVVKKWGELLDALPLSPLVGDLVAKADEYLPEEWQRRWLNGALNKRGPSIEISKQSTEPLPERLGEPLPERYAKPQNTNPKHKTQTPKHKNTSAAKATPDPRVTETMLLLEGERGYVSTRYAGEASAVLAMLKQGYNPEDILGCWKTMKAEKFYQDKECFLNSVQGQIGNWKRQQGGEDGAVGIRSNVTQSGFD